MEENKITMLNGTIVNTTGITLDGSKIATGPSYVGAWFVGGYTRFYILKRPTDEQIKNTENLLGWKWEEL